MDQPTPAVGYRLVTGDGMLVTEGTFDDLTVQACSTTEGRQRILREIRPVVKELQALVHCELVPRLPPVASLAGVDPNLPCVLQIILDLFSLAEGSRHPRKAEKLTPYVDDGADSKKDADFDDSKTENKIAAFAEYWKEVHNKSVVSSRSSDLNFQRTMKNNSKLWWTLRHQQVSSTTKEMAFCGC